MLSSAYRGTTQRCTVVPMHRGIFICPAVLTCNRGYGVVYGCSVGGCGCGMPPDHPRCHPCYTLLTPRASSASKHRSSPTLATTTQSRFGTACRRSTELVVLPHACHSTVNSSTCANETTNPLFPGFQMSRRPLFSLKLPVSPLLMRTSFWHSLRGSRSHFRHLLLPWMPCHRVNSPWTMSS